MDKVKNCVKSRDYSKENVDLILAKVGLKWENGKIKINFFMVKLIE
jgi:hypothetical protein